MDPTTSDLPRRPAAPPRQRRRRFPDQAPDQAAVRRSAGRRVLALMVLLGLAAGPSARAGSWPTERADNQRSGVSSDRLGWPLAEIWVHQPQHPPSPAWPAPARQDYWHHAHGLSPTMIYDRAFHVAVSDGALVYGSSADDTVRCLDAAAGVLRWSFTTEGPVRLAPSIAGGKVYFGSDDGQVTCLDLRDGRLLWRHRVGPEDRRLPGNGRMISLWPVRSGVLIEDGVAYAAAGLFPQQGSFLVAMEATTGREIWSRRIDVSVQGAMALSPRRLLLPTGRTPPAVFDRRDGTPLGSLGGASGSFAVVLDDLVVHGGGERVGLDLADRQSSERIVSVPALRLVADGPMIYFLREGSLVALDRTRYLELSRRIAPIEAVDAKQRTADQRSTLERLRAERLACQKWAAACDAPYELVAAADAVIAGGRDEIIAYGRETGQVVWRAPVRGRAYALALSDGRLYAGTDEGAIHCFEQAPAARSPSETRAPVGSTRPAHPTGTSPPIVERTDDLLGWWIFERDSSGSRIVTDRAGQTPARAPLGAVFDDGPEAGFLRLDGTRGITLGEDLDALALPRTEMTVESWVRVDQPLQWGGIIGVLQDNGSYEKGWLLGYSETRFLFAIKSESTERLTYLKSTAPQDPRVWHHVAGTYDGRTMRLYVDGELAGESSDQQGAIDYPPHAFYEIGAYHDDDEFFALSGALHEVRLLDRVLTPEAIRSHWQEKAAWFAPPLGLSDPPEVTLLDDGRARLAFTVDAGAHDPPRRLAVAFGRDPARLADTIPVRRVAAHDEVILGPLPARTLIYYQILAETAGAPAPIESALFHFDSGPQPFRRPRPYDLTRSGVDWEAAARAILERSGIDQGYCLVLGAGRGELAYELARLSHLRIIGVENDPEKLAAARQALQSVGLSGTRIVIHDVAPEALPYPDLFANLIVSAASFETGEAPAAPCAEVERLLRPCGGTLLLHAATPEVLQAWFGEAPPAGLELTRQPSGAWATVHRGPLAGSGEWTQTYGEPGNTACSGDTLAAGTMELQWFGRPGPRRMIDRHHRNIPPLYKDGRCFVPGDGIVHAVDAYNGTILWQVEVPDSRRLGVFLDSSNLMVDDRYLYLAARDGCNLFDVRTGKAVTRYTVPGREDGAARHWSYLARHDDLLLGSTCRPSAPYQETSYDADASLWYRGMKLVTSDALFALDTPSGEIAWRYQGSVILNTSLTVGGDRLFFIETTGQAACDDLLGRMPLATFFAGGEARLVSLDLRSGQVVYRRPIDTTDLQETSYLGFKDGVVLLSGSRASGGTVAYHLFALDARTGDRLWEENHDSGLTDDGGHGEYNRHPTIVGHTVYAWPYAFDLTSGKRDPDWRFDRRGHGCGGVSASAVSLFWRGGNPWMFDLTPEGGPQRLTAVTRPGCWINIIPAGGLVLMPEASSGCTCPFSVQCSMAMRPGVPPPVLVQGAPVFVRRSEVSLALRQAAPGGTIHYTLDGRVPDADAPLYTRPIVLERTTRLRARTVLAGGRKSRIEEWTFERVTPQPAASPGRVLPGLSFRVLEGARVSRLAGMQAWAVAAEGIVPEPAGDARGPSPAVSLEGLPHREDDFGVIWHGLVRIPEDGVYTFTTRSDDGSSLAIDGEIVVDNDGLHGAAARSGQCALQKGWHPIEIRFFEAAGNNVMEVRWSGPGITDRPLPADVIGHTPETDPGGSR